MAWWDLKPRFQDLSRRLGFSATTSAHFSSINSPLIDKKNEEEFGQRKVQLDSHTMKTVARRHMRDWIMLVILALIEIILNMINPFYRFVGKEMMTDLKYPLKSNTVPVWAVPMYSIALPVAIFVVVYYRRRDIYDLHHAILGLLFSILVTAVITDAIKDAVGRPRPDFFWRCFPDGKDVYDKWGDVICHGDKKVIKEGHKSFPSGHTSWSFAGLGFLSLYLSGKLKAFDCKGHIAKLCIIFLPLLVASLVAVSRVDDYWHHWQDVFSGGLIGLVVATFCYLQFFPLPNHPEGWGPYAYFKMLEESRAAAEAHNAENGSLEAQTENQEGQSQHGFLGLSLTENQAQSENQEGQSQHGCIGLSLRENQTSTLEDDELESGRRERLDT